MQSKSLVDKHNKRYNKLFDKYIETILPQLFNPEALEEYFPKEYTKNVNIKDTCHQINNFARQYLKETNRKLWNDQGVGDALKRLDVLAKERDPSTRLLREPDGPDPTYTPNRKLVPQPEQIVRAEMYRIKIEHLKRLRDLQGILQKENDTRAHSIQQKIKEDEELTATLSIPSINPPQIDPSSI